MEVFWVVLIVSVLGFCFRKVYLRGAKRGYQAGYKAGADWILEEWKKEVEEEE